MKKILGLDLGTTSIGWALVNSAENESERSSIVKLGVRVNPLTVDEQTNFEKGKSITTNADRTLKRSMRRNLHRYKLRRENLIQLLIEHVIINADTVLSESGNRTTFETLSLRAKAASEEVTLEQFARILLQINKKRGYKSSRKVKSADEGQLIDGMEIAKKLYDENITPGQFVLELLKAGKKYVPDFYRSDLQAEFDHIWNFQKRFYPDILTDEFKKQIAGKGKMNTSKIFLGKYGIYTADNKGKDKRIQAYQWRADALVKEMTQEEVAFVVSDLNGTISGSSGYLGSISDRSKELFFNKQTVGQAQWEKIEKNPNYSLKNEVFYRQDYLDEFNTIWQTQSRFHRKLTDEFKSEIRDVVIFFQRNLKSQKGLVGLCELENKKVEAEVDGKKKVITIGSKVCPKSSPLFQEFKIWQIINNIEVREKSDSKNKRPLEQDEKELLFTELNVKEKLTKDEVLRLLSHNPSKYDLNYKIIEGNRTQAALIASYQTIIELSGHGEYDFLRMPAAEIISTITGVLNGLGYKNDFLKFDAELDKKEFEKQPLYLLWHLLYSYEGDNSNTGDEKLLLKISELCGFEKEYAKIVANVTLQPDYGSLSAKAIRKILPFLKEGNGYDVACEYAGYRHSKSSLTKEEIKNKILKDRLEVLQKNNLRNPVVEKILNQMVNVVNAIIETYGKPDEIVVELARDLKKSAQEREDATKAIADNTKEHERIQNILKHEFGFGYISRNDIIRYKLYLELESRGFKTLYSNTYISREKLFSKEFDIEHIIPQAKLFDDSFSNKTLELRSVNIEKGNSTAHDFVLAKYGESGCDAYLENIEAMRKTISSSKYKKLKMREADIPNGFIDRELRNTQYIAKKAKTILEEIVKTVVSTGGSVTSRLREDWQLINVMQELNWDKYHKLGLTAYVENRDGQQLPRIKDWTKRNDHRHHAMDALTVAFTKPCHIQYLNNLNARSDKSGSIYGIETRELHRDDKNKLRFKPPIPLNDFRAEAKSHLENTLVSIKAKNKVTTRNVNATKKGGGVKKTIQLTPRGQLHQETVYGSCKQYISKSESIGSSFDEQKILTVAKKSYRDALLRRLVEHGNDPKKAFTGKNSLEKNPLFVDELQTRKVPARIDIVSIETIFTVRKPITKDLKIEKVLDAKIREILQMRLSEFNNDPQKAFTNLDENPIWLNKDRGICIKRVTITGPTNVISLNDKRDKDGKLILDETGTRQPVDFVSTGNNHHVAIYRDKDGKLQENIVSFFEATELSRQGLPIVDRFHKQVEGWEFLFTMKQNEYFVFPNEATNFDPIEIDLLNPQNYALISPNLFRVQKIATKNYFFRHHLETDVEERKQLSGITYKAQLGLKGINGIVKVRINHIGSIVSVGEY